MLDRYITTLTSKSGLGALLLFICAVITFDQVSGLYMGTASAMGPGYFPAILGGLFIFFGLLLLIEGWRSSSDRVYVGQLRPVAFLLGSIVLFGLLYPVGGGAVSIAALVIASALAERNRSWREIAGMIIVVLAIVWIVFVVALDLQLNMLPSWMLE